MRSARTWVGLSALLALACESPTQFIVVVDSDIAELSLVRVGASTEAETDEHSFEIEQTGIPFSLGVGRGPSDSDVLRLSVDGFVDGRPNAFVSRTIETRFLPGEVRQIHVSLNRDCASVDTELDCADSDMTCLGGACIATFLDPSTLPSGDPDVTPRMPDAGPRTDAGPPDASDECVVGAECVDPDNPCMSGRWTCDSDTPLCEISATLLPGSDCGGGRTCSEEGACV